MFSPFHILKVQSDGSLRWMEWAVNVERAKARVEVLAASSASEYVITNLTGEKIPSKSQPKRIMFQTRNSVANDYSEQCRLLVVRFHPSKLLY
jgi:hypothetical protein